MKKKDIIFLFVIVIIAIILGAVCGKIKFEFTGESDIINIGKSIGEYVL